MSPEYVIKCRARGPKARPRRDLRTDGKAVLRRATRTCGSCRACCIAPSVLELRKAMDEPCRHLNPDPSGHEACTIYSNRPEVCRGFLCGWRLGLGEEQDRPDRSGVLIQPTSADGKSAMLAFVELWPDAFESPRSRELLLAWGAETGGVVTMRFSGRREFVRVPLTMGRVVVRDDPRRMVCSSSGKGMSQAA